MLDFEMLSSAAMVGGNMPPDLQNTARSVCNYFEQGVRVEVQRRNLPAAIFPALFPCNIFCVADKENLHVVFTNINAGGMPTEKWLDGRKEGAFPPEEVTRAAIQQVGFEKPANFSIKLRVMDLAEKKQREILSQLAVAYVGEMTKLATRPKTIPGYEGLQPHLDVFSNDHPEFDKNVFVAMRFRTTEQFLEIHEAIKSGLGKYGLNALRSDDKVYPTDGDVWDNVCIYMMGCKYGVCVFEEIDDREFNPNVPLEYGFLRARNQQVLLLKDQRMPAMPTDITGKLYRPFDTYDITTTIREQIGLWLERDLGLSPAG